MRCLKITVAYRGTNFCGWQVQEGLPSIQQSLEEAYQTVTSEHVRIIGSGRTDAGVHALGQVASLSTESDMDCDRLMRALNATTPNDISVLNIQDAVTGFHAIQNAKRKTYRYQIQYGRIPDPLNRDFYWFIPNPLAVDAMQNACKQFLGEHDFVGFQAAGGVRKTTVRTIYNCKLEKETYGAFNRLIFEIEGNGFLYNMVRNIVGSLVEIGKGKQTPDWVTELIQQKNRNLAGETAPAKGLILLNVDY
jgi:tRNA pseudouridine38-40 synthase